MKRSLLALGALLLLLATPAAATTLVDGSQINRVWAGTNFSGQPGLQILGSTGNLTASGRVVIDSTGLIKGNLTTRGTLSGASLVVSNLLSCTNVQTGSNGALSCNNAAYVTTLPTSLVSGTGASTQIMYATGPHTISGATLLTVDEANHRIGIGKKSPLVALDVVGTISGSSLTLNGPGNNSSILGNLGIGETKAPAAKLEVAGALSGASLTLNGTSASTVGLKIVTPNSQTADLVDVMSGSTVLDKILPGGTFRHVLQDPYNRNVYSFETYSTHNASRAFYVLSDAGASNLHLGTEYSNVHIFLEGGAGTDMIMNMNYTQGLGTQILYNNDLITWNNSSSHYARFTVPSGLGTGRDYLQAYTVGGTSSGAGLHLAGVGNAVAFGGVTGTPDTFLYRKSIRQLGTDSTLLVLSGSIAVNKSKALSKLDVAGTISGSTLQGTAINALQTFQGAGLTDCSNSTTSKLLWASATKTFSCGTDQTGGGGSGGGNISGTGANTQVAYFTAAHTISGATLLKIDEANHRLGIGKAASTALDVVGTISGSLLTLNGPANNSYILGNLGLGTTKAPVTKLEVAGTLSGSLLTLSNPTGVSYSLGNISIGKTTSAAKLDVAGTISGAALVISGLNTTTFATHAYTWPTAQGTANQVLTNNGSDTLSWASPTSTSIYGNGGSGAITLSSATNLNPNIQHSFTSFTLNSSTNLGVNAANTPLVIAVTGDATINGNFNLSGSGATGGTHGTTGTTGTAGNTLVSGWTSGGGTGGSGNSGGGGGASVLASGNGASNGSSGTGGGGGTTMNASQLAFLGNILRGVGCGGGGGGGANNGQTGGDGGKGAGCLAMFVGGNLTLGASATISANGSAGTNGSGSAHGGGGGGGGGTIIIVVAGTITDNGVTVSATGGSGGTGVGPGTNGGSGAAGRVLIYSLSTGKLITA